MIISCRTKFNLKKLIKFLYRKNKFPNNINHAGNFQK